jgi:hypothetical protein
MLGPTGAVVCRDVVARATDYLEGALDPHMRLAFEAHVVSCPGCAIYMRQIRTSIGLLRQLDEPWPSPRSRERLLDSFREWKRRELDDDLF